MLVGGVGLFALLNVSTPWLYSDPMRPLVLEDGTIAHVTPDTAVHFEFNDQARVLFLSRGEVVIEVAKDDARRPFIARTRWTDSVATGTRYGVAIAEDGAVTTTVSEGSVRVVAPAGADFMAGTLVSAGEEFRVIPGASQPERVIPVNAERKLSWATGWLIIENKTAAEVVALYNRYSRGKVKLAITQPELSTAPMLYQRIAIGRHNEAANAIAIVLNTSVTYDAARDVLLIGEPPAAK